MPVLIAAIFYFHCLFQVREEELSRFQAVHLDIAKTIKGMLVHFYTYNKALVLIDLFCDILWSIESQISVVNKSQSSSLFVETSSSPSLAWTAFSDQYFEGSFEDPFLDAEGDSTESTDSSQSAEDNDPADADGGGDGERDKEVGTPDPSDVPENIEDNSADTSPDHSTRCVQWSL